MKSNHLNKKRFLSGFSPWIIIGAAALLLPIFSLMTIETLKRQKENSIRLLLEKGAALIKAFEAGTRTGLLGDSFDGRQLQRLLSETAMQKDIAYLLVVDTNGLILAHSDRTQIGKYYGYDLDLKKIVTSRLLKHRSVKSLDGRPFFEVIHKFSPVNEIPESIVNALKMFQQLCRPHNPNWKKIKPTEFVIFIGLDMTSVEETRKADAKHAIIMGAVFLLTGFTGVVLLFFTDNYRATRSSLSRIKAFSDNIVENMPIGLIALDDQKRVASFNQVAESLFPPLSALNTENGHQTDVADVLPRELWAMIEHPDMQQGIIEKEINCPIAKNRRIPMDVSSTLLYDADRNFLGYIFLVKDLSDIQTLRNEIERHQRLAAVGRLAAGVAHEIRNPLSSLKGFATYLKEKYQTVPKDQKVADIMIQEVDRLNRVVSQLLEFAKPIEIRHQATDIVVLIENAVKLVQAQAMTQHVTIETDLAADLHEVQIDPDKISQVMLNLLLNAIEAIRENGKVQVRLTGQAPNGICISIADNGPGISSSDRSHIFDPFFTTKNTGTGLGLAIVHNIIEAHKGDIVVDRSPLGGAQIEIRLPERKTA